METIIQFLTDPKIVSLLTVPIVVMVVEGYVIYKLFQKYDSLQEARLKEWEAMNRDYMDLSKQINSTLDLLIKLSGKKNGGSSNG